MSSASAFLLDDRRLRVRSDLLARWSYLLIAALALPPRLLNLGAFATVDEIDHWMPRASDFFAALRARTYAATAISAHPGVTTMWLGGLGDLLSDMLVARHLLPAGGFAARLALMQLPVALVNACAILLGYYLLRRMLPPAIAVCAAALWAADPFLIGYSRVLHVDALTASFTTLSVLAACVYWHHAPRHRFVVISGVCAALAALSKSPGLAALPVIALVALNAREPRRSLAPLALLGGCFILTVALLWPAALVAPGAVVRLIASGVQENADMPHSHGNFFLGQDNPAPGLLFYPVALALRTTPLTLIGLLLLPFACRRLSQRTWRDLGALAVLALALILMLSLFPKKFNRYLVPAFPAVDILAAYGLMGMRDWGQRIRRGWRSQPLTAIRHSPVPAMYVGAIVLAAGLNAAYWHPYGIDAFNQLLGGAPAGARTFQAGWGEGLEQAADWLNQQPDIGQATIATTVKGPLAPYLRPGLAAMQPQRDIPARVEYAVIYIRHAQGGPPDPPFDDVYDRAALIHTVTIRGAPLAWIYQIPPRVETPTDAAFGDRLRLRGFTLKPADSAGPITLDLSWETLAPVAARYATFVHVIGADGQCYARVDLPLARDHVEAHRFLATSVPLRLPASAPAGAYHVSVGLYEQASGQRLALRAPGEGDRAIDGAGALVLTSIRNP